MLGINPFIPKWSVFYWIIDNFFIGSNELVIIFYQLINEYYIIWDSFLDKNLNVLALLNYIFTIKNLIKKI